MNIEADEEDPFGFIIKEYKISPSQEELLRNTPLVGDYTPHHPILPSPPSLTHHFNLPHLHHSTLNLAADIHDKSHCFVDLTQDSDLGFSNPHPNYEGLELPRMSELIRFLLDKATESDKDNFSVFDVLQFLAKKKIVGEVEVEVNGLSVLEVAKLAGITFPRPRWWPKHFESKLFNFHD